MNIFKKAADFFGTSVMTVFKEGADIVDRFVQTGEQKAEAKIKLKEVLHNQQMQFMLLMNEGEKEFNQRIRDLEGTAKDLLQAGFLGKVILFLRGAQRPLWGYYVGYMDWQVFSGGWVLTKQMESVMYAINFLVLGFLFGERAVKNILPVIQQKLGNKKEENEK